MNNDDVSIFIKIYNNDTNYDRFCMNENGLVRYVKRRPNEPTKRKIYLIEINGVQIHYLLRELNHCDTIRLNIIKNTNRNINIIKFMLVPTDYNTIDYNWNERVCDMVRERSELDHTMSWLSTLGGAFSALGDYFLNMAETAGKISMQQLKLAMRLGDPTIQARCKLYFSLSLIQKRCFKTARDIILNEYRHANECNVRDERLIKMCKGIWSKLRYEWEYHRIQSKFESISAVY